MKIKTSELSGAVLDWAVVRSNRFIPFTDGISWLIEENGVYKQIPKYSTEWAQGGEIIEREGLQLWKGGSWNAAYGNSVNPPDDEILSGPTPLIAAMRCYVASKLGDEIEVPKEVIDEEMK